MSEPILWDAHQAGQAIGVTAASFRRMVADGRIPRCVEHRASCGAEKNRRYSVLLLKLWAANVDIERLTDHDLVLDLTTGMVPAVEPEPEPARFHEHAEVLS